MQVGLLTGFQSSRETRLPVPFFAFLLVWIGFSVASIALEEHTEMDSTSVVDPLSQMTTTTLSNGLTVLTLPDSSTPVVSFQIWVQAGSVDETNFTGIAHLFEHMMFRGSKSLPPEAHSRLIEARGGRVNAFTSRDVTVYHAEVSRENLPLVIALESERLHNLDISKSSLASERQVVLEERRLRTEDSPTGRAFEALFAQVFQAHSYRHPTIGWRSDIENVEVEHCQEFFETFYAPNNLVISIAGDFDEEETLSLVQKYFAGLGRRRPPVRTPRKEPEQTGPRRAEVILPVRSSLIAVGWSAPRAGHSDGPALDVASEILSGGRSSRLYRRLVYEEEIALSANGYYWELSQGGVFYAFVRVRPGASVSVTESVFFEEIEKIANLEVSEKELKKAKRNLEVALLKGHTTSHSLAQRMGSEVITFGRVRPLAERLQAVRAVTAEDVRRVAINYLAKTRSSTVNVIAPDLHSQILKSNLASHLQSPSQ